MNDFIRFPEFGIEFNVSPSAFSIFGKDIYFYGIVIAIGFALGLILAFKSASKYGIDSSILSDLIIFGTPTAIVFARIFYVIFEWDNYKDNLLQIFNLRNGGLAIYGGVIGAAIAVSIYSKIKKVKILKYLDFLAPYFVMAQGIGRLGNFFNQEAFGPNTELPWGMTGNLITNELVRLRASGINIDPSLNVHPTFLYEVIWNMIVFSILLYIRKRSKKDGKTVFAYMALYGFGRMFIEGLRMDSLMMGGIRVNQLLALLLFLVFGGLFYLYSKERKQKKEVILEETGNSPFSDIARKIREEAEKKEESKIDE